MTEKGLTEHLVLRWVLVIVLLGLVLLIPLPPGDVRPRVLSSAAPPHELRLSLSATR